MTMGQFRYDGLIKVDFEYRQPELLPVGAMVTVAVYLASVALTGQNGSAPHDTTGTESQPLSRGPTPTIGTARSIDRGTL